MSKDYVTVTTHRRALPKRKFADGGVSADQDRPDLTILARQGLSPEKPPGMPPRIKAEYLMTGRSDADTGGGKPVSLERASDDAVRIPGGSVLSQMMDTSADRVQSAHDAARSMALVKAIRDAIAAPPQKKAIGGDIDDDPFAVPSDEDLAYQDDQEAQQRKQAYGADFTPAMTSGRRTAELAAPPASVSPSRGSANREANSPAPPKPLDFGKDTTPSSTTRGAVPIAASTVKATSARATPAASTSPATSASDDEAASSTYGSPANKIDWLQVVQKGLGDGRSTNPISALGGIGGAALGAYLRKRRADRQPPPTPEKWSGEGDQVDLPSVRDLADLPQNLGSMEKLPLSGGDYEFPDYGLAEGGKVSPSDSGRGSMRGGRPMRRPAGTSSYTPPPGSAPTFPGGVGQVAPQYGGGSQMTPMGAGGPSNAQLAGASAPPPSMGAQLGRGMPPGGPPPGGPGVDPNMMARMLAERAQMQGAVPPGGPPPGGGAMGPMGGAPPGVMPGMGGSPSGPPPGAMPPGGPPSGPPPGAMPPGGPPPGGGPSLGAMQGNQQQALQAALANQQAAMGPPPGGPPPGGPPSGMGTLPPPGSSDLPGAGTAALGQQQVAQLMQQNAAARSLFGAQAPTSGSTSNQGMMPQGGPPSDPRVQALIAAQMRQQQPQGMAKGGPVEDTEGFSPRAKHARVRQFGDVGKPAEKLPPEPYKKGGKVKHRAPFGSGKKVAKSAPPVPMVTDDDMGAPPAMGLGAAAPTPAPMAAPPPPVAPPPGPPPGMAMGGVAKLRRGYPNTNGKAKSKKMATGGKVRGCGAATKGCGFGGVC